MNKYYKFLNVNWYLLQQTHTVQECCHHWVTDESITYSLNHFHFDDPSIPHNEKTHRANRIASMIRMIEGGITFKPLRIRITNGNVHLSDGHHRLRAYQYLNKLHCINIKARGDITSIKNAVINWQTFGIYHKPIGIKFLKWVI